MRRAKGEEPFLRMRVGGQSEIEGTTINAEICGAGETRGRQRCGGRHVGGLMVKIAGARGDPSQLARGEFSAAPRSRWVRAIGSGVFRAGKDRPGVRIAAP